MLLNTLTSSLYVGYIFKLAWLDTGDISYIMNISSWNDSLASIQEVELDKQINEFKGFSDAIVR